MLDIHDLQPQFERIDDYVKLSQLSPRNKALILAYRDACLIRNVCGKTRLIRVLPNIVRLGLMFGKDFDQVTRQDVERVIGALVRRQPALRPQTIGTVKAVLRTFLTYVTYPDQYPDVETAPVVSWVHSYVRARDKKRLERKDLLTTEDIELLLHASRNLRDKALVAMLWESGARIAEIGNLQLKHVTKHQCGYVVDLNGKTGHRSPLLISSAPYLTIWLNNHPFRNNPDSPLWVYYQYSEEPVLLVYDGIRKMLKRTFDRAKISKPCHPHLFRHSRATHVLARGIMNEQQAKTYFGWTADSSMLATYSHLIDQDANNAIMKENNMAPVIITKEELRPPACTVCREVNPPEGQHCVRCGNPLRPDSLYMQRAPIAQQGILADLLQLAIRNGITNDVLDVVHRAGLGPTLRELTNQPQQDKPQ